MYSSKIWDGKMKNRALKPAVSLTNYMWTIIGTLMQYLGEQYGMEQLEAMGHETRFARGTGRTSKEDRLLEPEETTSQ